ncbi:hypothetical protein GCM10023160_04990 [Brachybacterium paraconglomeratum]
MHRAAQGGGEGGGGVALRDRSAGGSGRRRHHSTGRFRRGGTIDIHPVTVEGATALTHRPKGPVR